MTAAAQQTAPAPQNSQPAVTQTAAPAARPQPAQQPRRQPTTMDQVVDRVIMREKDLITCSVAPHADRGNLSAEPEADPQLGPDSAGRSLFPRPHGSERNHRPLATILTTRGGLKGKEESLEKHLLGGLTKSFKFQYQPLGFSWMVFADRDDFDRAALRFPLRAPRVSGRRALPGIRCHAQKRRRPRPLPRPHLGRRSGFQHRSPERHLRAPVAATHYYFHMDSWRLNLIPGLLGARLHLQRRRRLHRRREKQDRFQGADPHLGL